MKQIAISIKNLSKQYRLGVVGTGTVSHDLNRWWTTVVRGKEDPYLKIGEKNEQSKKGQSDYVWALKNINLEIAEGDVVGIIGKNGAGKSTLLKILSRVTKPTEGTISYNGRIASLLEVGTGFHPEMTGRENIYMNGAIMGMRKSEIARKFDEIVAFSGIERYVDTPVKRYSSGMTVRLGFSVAAHLEPDILVVDEVLAVGDAEFQKKAIGKMQDVSKEKGRTVLFVSHNMGAIKDLCPNAILLENGEIIEAGPSDKVVNTYLTKQSKSLLSTKYNEADAPGNENVKLLEARVYSNDEKPDFFTTDKDIIFEFRFLNKIKGNNNLDIAFHLVDELGNLIFMNNSSFVHEKVFSEGVIKGKCVLPGNILNEGFYTIEKLHFVKNRGNIQLEIRDVLCFELFKPVKSNYGYMGPKQGLIKPILSWELDLLNND